MEEALWRRLCGGGSVEAALWRRLCLGSQRADASGDACARKRLKAVSEGRRADSETLVWQVPLAFIEGSSAARGGSWAGAKRTSEGRQIWGGRGNRRPGVAEVFRT